MAQQNRKHTSAPSNKWMIAFLVFFALCIGQAIYIFFVTGKENQYKTSYEQIYSSNASNQQSCIKQAESSYGWASLGASSDAANPLDSNSAASGVASGAATAEGNEIAACQSEYPTQ
jgi:hypothetical protein